MESGERQGPSAQTDTANAVGTTGGPAADAAAWAFVQGGSFSVDGEPAFLASDAADLLGQAAADIEDALGSLPGLAKVDRLYAGLTDISGSLTSLVQAPVTLADEVMGTFTGTPVADIRLRLGGDQWIESTNPGPAPRRSRRRPAQRC